MSDTPGIRSIENLADNALKWVQPSSGRYYELVVDGEVYATLKWEGIFGSLATGRTWDVIYTFKRAGFIMPYVTVRKSGYDQEIGRMRMGFGGYGSLDLVDGRRLSFIKSGFWNPEWTFVSEHGLRLCTFTMASRLVRREADVVLEPDARRVPDIAMLLLLGWYTIILQAEEAAAATHDASGAAFMGAAAAAAASIPPPPSH